MEKMLDLITGEVTKAFTACGYDEKYARVTLSNRPDLCEYQCNGALAAAKEYHCAPFMISDKVAEELKQSEMFESVDSVKPGFLNLILSKEYLASYMQSMQKDEERLGCEKAKNPKTIIIDYGGPNVAKPLHVGHLRSAIIGESIKRIGKFMGHKVIGDVHLGDWGLQMGLIITELRERKPELVYYDENYTGEYPKEAPFTISELEEIYPTASAKSKEDEAYKEAAMKATSELQAGRRGYQALLAHILNVSVTDLKKNYENLNVSFELWKGESDAQPYIPDMVEQMKKDGFAYMSDGALVVDVAKEEDTKEIPPCIILKSDGASLYTTTDLATLIMREQDYHPDEVVYAPIIKREDERLDWNKTAREIFNHVRGLYPHPGTFTTYNGQVVKIYKGEIHNCPNAKEHHKDEKNGTIVKIFKDAIGVKVEDGVFVITEIQLSGKKRMSVKDYLNGKNIFEVGTQFE